jgi:hypothetical protein
MNSLLTILQTQRCPRRHSKTEITATIPLTACLVLFNTAPKSMLAAMLDTSEVRPRRAQHVSMQQLNTSMAINEMPTRTVPSSSPAWSVQRYNLTSNGLFQSGHHPAHAKSITAAAIACEVQPIRCCRRSWQLKNVALMKASV